ncbi:MAG: extracellular solute-binding protein [Anaerolineaceae bacterium]|nr:MAG: extracellular solute-binding protein [Anaerolineaceae bacterium]
MKRKLTSLFLCLILLTSLLAGCVGKNERENNSLTNGQTKDYINSSGVDKYPRFITVDLFNSYSNYQGIQGGWFGHVIKERFNMELNIIAPNASGSGDTLYQTRSAAGNIGDLIIFNLEGGKLQELVSAGLVLDMSPYIKKSKNLETYKRAIDTTNKKLVSETGTWAIPSEVTVQSSTDMINTVSLNSGIYIRWDLYKQLGYPKMATFEDLLPVMKDMQDIAGTSDSGKKVYAFSLFKDWDVAIIQAGQQLPANYGWGMEGFVLQKADDSEDPIDFLAENSPYIRGLRFFYQANQMGLLDPESRTQNWNTLYGKYEDGSVLYSPWPWLGKVAYNTSVHTEEGKGFHTAAIDDLTIREWGCYENGNPEYGIMVGSRAQDSQRMVDFIDWLYSPEGIQMSQFAIVDEMYELENGLPVLTELGKEVFLEGDADMPDNYNGGSYKDGRSQLGFKIVSISEMNPATGYTYTQETWPSYIEVTSTSIDIDWQNHMGASNATEYWKKNNQICISPGTDYAAPPDSTDIATMRSQITEISKEYSWKAIYAKDDADFNAIIAEMRTIVEGLGYYDVVKVDMDNAAALKAARWE